MSSNYQDSSETQAWRNARLRSRMAAIAINVIGAPLLIAVAMSLFLSRDVSGGELQFRDLLMIGLIFVPGVAVAAAWHTRLLTIEKPITDRALAGIASIAGVLLNLAALAGTLVLLAIGATVYFAVLWGLTPELALTLLLRFLLGACLLFLALTPSFVAAGAILGLATAAVIHWAYQPDNAPGLTPTVTAFLALLLIGLSFYLYFQAGSGTHLLPSA